MTNVKYKADAVHMARIKIGAVRALQDIETGVFYYDMCDECGMLLNEDDMGFGHDCE